MEDLTITIKNLSTLILKNDISENSSLQKSLSDIYLLLKKADAATMEFNNGKINIDAKSNNHNDNFNSESIMNSKSSIPSSESSLTPIQLDNNIVKSGDSKDGNENVENNKNNHDILNFQNYENNSADELKTLEKEILIALKRLEKTTTTNLDSNKEK